ncbi:MAG: tripartite tricarboxylate transporter substrate binding protein [Ramlibacter sp.]|jgi:tripartite-type tricarboxylate transporter receptor subunit TctC|uniref:Bug family tripartite tricarboxylate transporter substrate binding protein n=1 Tax=Ramlibacter sp. TaxID=1917967 RepID=UPI00260CA20F|nr:tripartite tricarboxylate transporter substrate binding protein [Ramlibacter sp.]MDB5750021.1 tripartite tricarboxylate transporter substrate binding protein [Ramlibacter sp.]
MQQARRQFCTAAALGLLVGTQSRAQSPFPDRPIKFIVPTSPGSGPDVLARGLAQIMGARLNQPLVVENRPGAAANIGFQAMAKAPADGYTIGIVPNQFSINPHLYKLGFDPMKDLEPLCLVARGAMVLAVRPGLEAHDLASFIALAKKSEKPLTFASAGTGSPQHMAGALLQDMTGARLLHVPYSGVAGAMTAAISGEVDCMFMAVQQAVPHARSARARLLAVSTRRASPALPNVATADASGLPGFDVGLWFGLVAPSGVPAAVKARLIDEASRAIDDPQFEKTLQTQGLEPSYLPQQEFISLVRTDMDRWGPVVRRLNIKAE